MSAETLIKVEGVSKKFCRNLKKSLWYGMKDLGREVFGRGLGGDGALRPYELWAVNDVSFELKRGECLGLIGRNGAGKTTLLRMLNGLIKPDTGRIEMRGRVGALISLGAGFNPILTGRENIYVNGSVLGLSRKEITEKLDEIVDFAELYEFIDTPVQSYSSGMQVRLGFAIATTIKPDMLLLDEVLAVGDRSFRVKCFNRISRIQEMAAIIFVTHNIPQVDRICNKLMVLNKGVNIHFGSVPDGIKLYNENFSGEQNKLLRQKDGFELIEINISPVEISWQENLKFEFMYYSDIQIDNCNLRIVIYDEGGNGIAEWKCSNHDKNYKVQKGKNRICDELKNLNLRDDMYQMTFALTSENGIDYLILAHCYKSFTVRNGVYGHTSIQI